VETNVLGGSPYVADSRVPVRRLWAFYQSGATVEQLIRRFPHLSPAKIFDALAFALDNEAVIEADTLREQEMLKRASRKLPSRPRGAEQMELPFAGRQRR
jgi:uncharacterized protein (DUF433 family)